MLRDGSGRAKATAHTEEEGRRGQRSCREQYLGRPSSERLASPLPRIPMKNTHTLLLCPCNHEHVMLPCPLLKGEVISHPTQIFWDGTYAPVCIPALSAREGGRAALLAVWLLNRRCLLQGPVASLSCAYRQLHLQQHFAVGINEAWNCKSRLWELRACGGKAIRGIGVLKQWLKGCFCSFCS